MNLFLVALVTAVVSLVSYVPFINLLYKLKIQKDEEKSRTDILGIANKILPMLHAHKKGTPTAGGVLVFILTTVSFYLLSVSSTFRSSVDANKVTLIFVAFVLYGLFGLYDDIRKSIPNRNAEKLHIKAAHQFVIQIGISSLVSYFGVVSGLFRVSIPYILELTHPLAVFFVSVVVLTFMVNAVNITDGLDGLGAGAFLITIGTLSIVFYYLGFSTELLFLALLGGSIMGYLYYNINPARVFNGDASTFAIGSVFTVLMLMNNLFFVLPFFAFLYIAEGGSSLAQGLSRKYFNKKLFHIAPIHHHFEFIGWPETKVTMRFWLVHMFFSLAGLALFFWIYN